MQKTIMICDICKKGINHPVEIKLVSKKLEYFLLSKEYGYSKTYEVCEDCLDKIREFISGSLIDGKDS